MSNFKLQVGNLNFGHTTDGQAVIYPYLNRAFLFLKKNNNNKNHAFSLHPISP